MENAKSDFFSNPKYDDIKTIWIAEIKRKFKKYWYWLVFLYLFLVLLLWFYLTNIPERIFEFIIIVLALHFIYFYSLLKKISNKMVDDFLSAYGFEPTQDLLKQQQNTNQNRTFNFPLLNKISILTLAKDSIFLNNFKGDIFHQGSNKKIYKLYTNTKNNLKYFEFSFVIGSGKNRKTVYVQLIQKQLQDSYPHIFIMPDIKFLPDLPKFGYKKVDLTSSEFNKNYTLYCQNEDYGAKLYELLEPDVIELMDNLKFSNFYIEIVENEMNFIFKSLPTRRSDFIAIMQIIEKIRK